MMLWICYAVFSVLAAGKISMLILSRNDQDRWMGPLTCTHVYNATSAMYTSKIKLEC